MQRASQRTRAECQPRPHSASKQNQCVFHNQSFVWAQVLLETGGSLLRSILPFIWAFTRRLAQAPNLLPCAGTARATHAVSASVAGYRCASGLTDRPDATKPKRYSLHTRQLRRAVCSFHHKTPEQFLVPHDVPATLREQCSSLAHTQGEALLSGGNAFHCLYLPVMTTYSTRDTRHSRSQ